MAFPAPARGTFPRTAPRMATALVTGGAGFLGSHLCDRLVDAGHDVLCVDNFYTGSKRNVRHLIGRNAFEVVRHDIVHPLYLEADLVFNLACPASPAAYQANPIKTIKTSTVGMVNVLGLAKRCGARLLHTSTSEVYGDPLVHPQTEDYWGHVNPLGPRSCYDEGKRVAESLCVNYAVQHGMPVRMVRIFNTYGPRMDPADGRVVSNFICQALRGEPLTVYGDGQQTRSFCYVSDLLDAILALMHYDPPDDRSDWEPGWEELGGAAPGPVNTGNPGEFTMLELAEAAIAEVTKQTGGCRSTVEHLPLPADDPRKRRPDISKAKRLLGWEPKVSLAEGLEPTVAFYRERLGL